MLKEIKSNKGITLYTLAIYIIVIIIIIGIMISFRSFFYGNINIIQAGAGYAESFDNFNTRFVEDVKSNTDVAISSNGNNKEIVFSNGVVYKYNYADRGIYRNNVKIASNVSAFETNKRIISIDTNSNNQQTQNNDEIYSIQKKVIRLNIIIGNSTNTMFSKRIDYTLKYW